MNDDDAPSGVTIKPRGLTFISHAREEKDFVKNLVDTMLRQGIQAWYDAYEVQPGMSIFRTAHRHHDP